MAESICKGCHGNELDSHEVTYSDSWNLGQFATAYERQQSRYSPEINMLFISRFYALMGDRQADIAGCGGARASAIYATAFVAPARRNYQTWRNNERGRIIDPPKQPNHSKSAKI